MGLTFIPMFITPYRFTMNKIHTKLFVNKTIDMHWKYDPICLYLLLDQIDGSDIVYLKISKKP